MTARVFSDDEGRQALGEAVAAAELLTSAEIVVAVRRHASVYAGTSVACGAVLAVLVLGYLWFAPTLYDVRLMPLEVLLAFVTGAFFCHSIDPLRRALTPSAARARAVSAAAEQTFHALGVEKTRGRNGVLVFVALMEGTAVLRPDEGIDLTTLGEPGRAVAERLHDAVARRELGAFTAALRELGALLGESHPRSEDDENELCDVHH